MGPFQFRLQRILRLRQQEVGAARRQLAAALERAAGARAGLAAIRARRQAELQAVLASEAAGAGATGFIQGRKYVALLRRLADQAAAAVAGAEAGVTAARRQLTEGRRRARMLELLRAARYEQYRLALTRAEQAELDELATQAFGPGR